MTLLVLALDALDEGLVDDFGCDGYKLDSYGHMESVTHMFDDIPHTGEVWPSVATGLHPSEHGITGGGEAQWNSRLVNFASTVAGDYLKLGMSLRNYLGDKVEEVTGTSWELATVDAPTFFEGNDREVQNWPGVHRNSELHRIWGVMDAGIPERGGDELTIAQFERKVFAIAAEQFGWLHEMLEQECEVAGVHIHALDACGHAYYDDRENLKRVYENIEDRIVALRNALGENDELLVLSDHGMETEWLQETNQPGIHSLRSVSTSTFDSRPEHVLDVKDWVEDHVKEIDIDRTSLDMPEEQLRQLGYVE